MVISGDTVILLASILFCLGFLGMLLYSSIVRIIISIEVMCLASIINFCYFAGGNTIKSGHFAAMITIILSGFVMGIIYAIFTTQHDEFDSKNILDEE